MYSEDKTMLKSTLAGVTKNISNLVAREKISSDKIGVFILMDGIEKVDESVVGYFEELEWMNNINLRTHYSMLPNWKSAIKGGFPVCMLNIRV